MRVLSLGRQGDRGPGDRRQRDRQHPAVDDGGVVRGRGHAVLLREGVRGVGILVHTPADTDLSRVTIRRCAVRGFLNGIKISRDGFRALPAGHEYDHALRDVTIEDSDVVITYVTRLIKVLKRNGFTQKEAVDACNVLVHVALSLTVTDMAVHEDKPEIFDTTISWLIRGMEHSHKEIGSAASRRRRNRASARNEYN